VWYEKIAIFNQYLALAGGVLSVVNKFRPFCMLIIASVDFVTLFISVTVMPQRSESSQQFMLKELACTVCSVLCRDLLISCITVSVSISRDRLCLHCTFVL